MTKHEWLHAERFVLAMPEAARKPLASLLVQTAGRVYHRHNQAARWAALFNLGEYQSSAKREVVEIVLRRLLQHLPSAPPASGGKPWDGQPVPPGMWLWSERVMGPRPPSSLVVAMAAQVAGDDGACRDTLLTLLFESRRFTALADLRDRWGVKARR